jgi:hypothetical protein
MPRPVRILPWIDFLLVLALLAGCDAGGASSGGGGAGGDAGGGAGGCLRVPQPTFRLKVLTQQGDPVPPDTAVQIHWSAGDEPPFHLDDPSSWPTLDTASFKCDVDPAAPPPVDLPALECALWTSSPTEVSVLAEDYVPHQDTYMAEPASTCNPEPTPIEIELVMAPR